LFYSTTWNVRVALDPWKDANNHQQDEKMNDASEFGGDRTATAAVTARTGVGNGRLLICIFARS
jgi:hypothetical protein